VHLIPAVCGIHRRWQAQPVHAYLPAVLAVLAITMEPVTPARLMRHVQEIVLAGPVQPAHLRIKAMPTLVPDLLTAIGTAPDGAIAG